MGDIVTFPDYPEETEGSRLAREVREEANSLSDAERSELADWGFARICGSVEEIAPPDYSEDARRALKAFLAGFVNGLADGHQLSPYKLMDPEDVEWDLGRALGAQKREENRKLMKRRDIEELTGKPHKGKV